MGNKVIIVCMGIATLILAMVSPTATAMTPEEMMSYIPILEQEIRPWSWDTPKRWAEIRKTTGPFTEEEIDIICQACDIAGDEAFAVYYPDILYNTGYMNLEKDTRGYDFTGHYQEAPEDYLYNSDGTVLAGSGDCAYFNLASSSCREWWLNEAAEQIAGNENEGAYFFIDALAKVGVVANGNYYDYLGNKVSGDGYWDACRTLLAELRDRFADKVFLTGNFARPGTGRTPFSMDYIHISYIEAFENFGDYVGNAHEAIALMQELSEAGRWIEITVNAYGKPVPMADMTLEEMRAQAEAAMPDIWAEYTETERDELAEIYAYFPFKLAMFLMGAGERSYFKYTASKVVRTAGRDLFKNIMPFPEWDMPLGEPLEPPQRNGNVYTRTFEHVEVVLNLDNGTCQFNERSYDPRVNVALSGTATQSSIDYGGVPERAIDGNTNGEWSGGSVTHTAFEDQPWWQVDLGAPYAIDEIQIYDRIDVRCANRLRDYDVSILNCSGDIVWTDHQLDSPEPSISLDPEGARGRFVKIQLRPRSEGEELDPLSLAEVRVFSASPAGYCGDLARDGQINLRDVAELSAGWQSQPGYTMDDLLYIANDWLAGTAPFVLSFDGVDDYVEIPGFTGISGGQARTTCAWIRTSQMGGSILSYGDGTSLGDWLFLVSSTGTLQLGVSGGNIIGTTFIADDQWHHVAAVLEAPPSGPSTVQDLRLYVDGILENGTYANPGLELNTGSALPVQIGTKSNPQNYFYQGLIDDVRIYDRALSDVEIGSVGNITDGLVAHWNLNEGSGTTVQDSVSGYTGTIYGGAQWIPE